MQVSKGRLSSLVAFLLPLFFWRNKEKGRKISVNPKRTAVFAAVLSACQKSPYGLFARFKNATFFVKLHFTKNLAVLVKKSDKSDVFDGCLSNSRRAASPSSSPVRRFTLCIHFQLFDSLKNVLFSLNRTFFSVSKKSSQTFLHASKTPRFL